MRCAPCHGETLQGASAGPLAGAAFAAAWTPGGLVGDRANSQLTVEDLDFIIRTTMPKGAPGRLTAKETAPAPPPLRVMGDASAVPKSGGPSQAELTAAETDTRDWLYHTHDYSGARYVALDQINERTAGQLRAVCAFQVGTDSSFQTGPIVYRGTMYITTVRDATNCRPKWPYTWVPRGHEVWLNNRGVAMQDGYVVALSAATGALIWAVKAADASQGETFTMAPLLFEHLVLIGPAGSENGISGWVGAFRLRDGSLVWKFQTVPGATQDGSESWRNPKEIKLGGGSVWTPFSLDPEKGQLFVAVTNPAPDLAASLRPGKSAVSLEGKRPGDFSGDHRWKGRHLASREPRRPRSGLFHAHHYYQKCKRGGISGGRSDMPRRAGRSRMERAGAESRDEHALCECGGLVQ